MSTILEGFFDAVLAGQQAGLALSDMLGRVSSLSWAIVGATADPMQLGRIQVMEPSKGAKSLSDWLVRCVPFGGITFPVPKLNDTFLGGYVDSDPHKGIYFGSLVNQLNPPLVSDATSLAIQVGQVTIQIHPDGSLNLQGVTNLSVDGQNISFTNVGSFSLNGKQVATLGAKDTRGDTLVQKGW